MEGFSSLLFETKNSSKINGVKVARGSPYINHLFSADNSFLFCRARSSDWQALHDELEIYEIAADQGINKKKFGIFLALTPIGWYGGQF